MRFFASRRRPFIPRAEAIPAGTFNRAAADADISADPMLSGCCPRFGAGFFVREDWMATFLLRPIAAVLVLIACILIALRLAWREYGGLVPLVGIGLPALVLAAVFGVPV